MAQQQVRSAPSDAAPPELDAALRRFRALVENASDGVVLVGPDARVEYVSASLEGMFGRTRDQILGTYGADWVDTADRERVLGMFSKLVGAPRAVARAEFGITGGDGQQRWVEATGRNFLDDPDVRAVMITVRDVTGRRRAEQDLQRAYEAERAAVARLKALDEMKNTFLNAVSHELRTPLSSVLGSALTLQRLGDEVGEEDRRLLLEAVVSNAKRLNHLLMDLLDLDRLTRGVARPRFVPEELGGLVRRVVEGGDFPLGRPIHLESASMVFPVDPPKVERIVENLLANAIKYSPAGSPIWVRVERIPEGALLTVEDCGEGIPEGMRASIFEPFYQGDNRSAHAPGVGIGLSLVARFADLHGGRAWVEDRQGGGSSFRVVLREPTAPIHE